MISKDIKYNPLDALVIAAALSPTLSALAGMLQGGLVVSRAFEMSKLSGEAAGVVGIGSFIVMIAVTQSIEALTLKKVGAVHNVSALTTYSLMEKKDAVKAVLMTAPLNILLSYFTNPNSYATSLVALFGERGQEMRMVMENLTADAVASLVVSILGCVLFASGAAEPVAKAVSRVREPLVARAKEVGEKFRTRLRSG